MKGVRHWLVVQLVVLMLYGCHTGPIGQDSGSPSDGSTQEKQDQPNRDYEAEIYPIVASEVITRCHIKSPIETYVFSTATTDKSIVRGWDSNQFRYQLDHIPVDLIAKFQELVRDDVPQSNLSRIWPHVVMLDPKEIGRLFFRNGPEWKAFAKKHPQPQGVWMFSRIGVSGDGEWAMMYVVSQSGNCEDGTIYVLRQDANAWVIDRTIPVWVA